MQNYNRKLSTTINTFLFFALLITGCLSIQFITSWVDYYKATTQPFPTSLPWVFTKSDCEHRGREWHNNKCWDSEHSMLF